MTDDTEELPDRDPCPDLPELTPAERAALNALPPDFAARICRGERPLDDPAVRERVRAAAEAAAADIEIVCNLCQERPPRPGDVLCAQCAPDNLLPAGARLAGGPWPATTHGELVLEIARLRDGCRKILARALRELTCAPGEEAPRTALRAILDESRALAEG